MKLTLLISALNADPGELIKKMNVRTDAVLINQCDRNDRYTLDSGDATVDVIETTDRGVGVSRNTALRNASGDIVLFSDDDIVYRDDLKDIIIKEFADHPEADGIFFNVDVCAERKTYENDAFARVRFNGVGRYPAYSFAVKLTALKDADISFSPLFGGGARYSCGEDSLFFMDCLKKGLKLFKSPVLIGEEIPRPSTWFKGYNEKYFFDRGVLYKILYGVFALPMGYRYVIKNRNKMCETVPPRKAISLIRDGIKEGKKIKKTSR